MRLPGHEMLHKARQRRVRRRLLRDDDALGGVEDIVDEVHHHGVVYVVPLLEGLLGLAVIVTMFASRSEVGWLFFVVGVGLAVHAAFRAFETYMDVFVITNLRVFRVSGLGPTKYASTPLSRILDITVDQTSLGLMLGYGHFTFESAAQEQGLRAIRFVAKPLARDRTIQKQQMRLLRTPRPDDRRP